MVAVPVVAQATGNDRLQLRGRPVKEDKTIGRVFLHDGSIINGRIVEADGKVSIATFDGNLFVYGKDEVLRVEFGKAYEPKSGALAVVLSLIFPGLGNCYVGDRVGGAIFLSLGIAGAAAMIAGSRVKSYFSYPRRTNRTSDEAVKAGAAVYLAASAVSAMSAYQGSKPPKIDNARVSLLSFEF